MRKDLYGLIGDDEYRNYRQETAEWINKAYNTSLSEAKLTKLEEFQDLDALTSDPAGVTPFGIPVKAQAQRSQRESAAKDLIKEMWKANMVDDGLKLRKADMAKAGGVTSGLGYNFYDLRAPVALLYPVNTPLRNSIQRIGRVNDGYGVAAHWKATRNPGYNYGGVSEGQRNSIGTPDENDYVATYKEFGGERAVTFTAQFAGEGYTNQLADEHVRGLQTVFLQEEGMILNGNSGSSYFGFTLGTAATPTGSGVTDHTVGTAGNITVPGQADLPYTTKLLNTQYVSAAVVYLTGMGNPNNLQYGYSGPISIAGGLTPSTKRNNADGSTDTIVGGMSAISPISTPVEALTGDLTIKFVLASSAVKKGVYGYAWFVDVEATNTGSLANAKFAGVTTTPWCYVTGTPTGTQVGTAPGLSSDNSYETLDMDGLLTLAATTSGAYFVDLGQQVLAGNATTNSLTPSKNGRIVEFETALETIFSNYQSGVDKIWCSPDVAPSIDSAIRWSGSGTTSFTGTGFQFMVNRDGQNNLLGGFVVSAYQSRFAVNNPTGGNAIPIAIHPMLPAGTIYFDVDKIPAGYEASRMPWVRGLLEQRGYYSIEWPVTTRSWNFGTYVHEVLAHYAPWLTGAIVGIGPFQAN